MLLNPSKVRVRCGSRRLKERIWVVDDAATDMERFQNLAPTVITAQSSAVPQEVFVQFALEHKENRRMPNM